MVTVIPAVTNMIAAMIATRPRFNDANVHRVGRQHDITVTKLDS